MRLLLMGSPGAGKGTLAGKLAERINVPHISTGDILRQAVKSGTKLGKQVEYIMNNGDLVPDDLMIKLVKKILSELTEGYILDGFPRTLSQAQSLNEFTVFDRIFYLDISDEIVLKRLSGRRTCPQCQKLYNIHYSPPEDSCHACGTDFSRTPLTIRKDDNETTVKNRLKVFHEMFDPLNAYYGEKKEFRKIDAKVSPEQVIASVMETIDGI